MEFFSSLLINAFYSGIENAMESRYLLGGLHRTLKKYRGLLTFGLRYFGFEFSPKDDAERLHIELESWIERVACRLVIIIDDIDRLQPGEILTVLKVVRLSARLRNTIFLLSFDPIIVLKTLAKTDEIDPEFLDKVVQKALPLPSAEQMHIDRFLLFSDPEGPEAHRSAIDYLLDELGIDEKRRSEFDEKISYFYKIRLRRLFRTVRQAKRYINGLRATLPPIADEVNLYDFFLLEAIRMAFPRIYQDIWRNPWFYIPPWSDDLFLSNPLRAASDEEEKYRQIKDHIDRLLEDEREADLARNILEEIFFIVIKNAYREFGRTGHDRVGQSYRAEKRLTHPKCFSKYFLFSIPAGEMSDSVAEHLIQKWNAIPVSEAEELIEKDIRRYSEAGQLMLFFDKLIIFIGLISIEKIVATVRALYRSAPRLSRNRIGLFSSEYERAEGLILLLIEERIETSEIQDVLMEVVREVDSLPFAVSVVLTCHRTGSNSLFRIHDNVDIQSLRNLAKERLHNRYIQDGHDIFEDLPEDDWGFILYQWGTDWMTDSGESRSDVNRYVMNLIDRGPQNLGKLLYHFTEKAGLGEGRVFGLQRFLKVYDPVATLERLDRYGDGAFSISTEREAGDLFRRSLAESQENSRWK